MNIYPAIDLMNGQAVRLTKGDFDTKEVFSSNPKQLLDSFVMCGAKYLHVVDLDGARSGSLSNFFTIKELAKTKNVFIEVGGGIRRRERIESYLKMGVNRVILGTAAAQDFDFLKNSVAEYGDRIAVGVDTIEGKVAVHGWEKISDIDGMEFCLRCRDIGVKTVIYTDISTDGTLSGTNMEAFYQLSKIDNLDIIASGGISTYGEIAELRSINISGAILGKALYKTLLDLKKAIAVAEGADA